jgi:hypothetical protein
MGAAENRAKNAAMAAHLKATGWYHGRRPHPGLSNIPPNEAGSAAYRRLMRKKVGRNAGDPRGGAA